jgi:hypothetical protein
VDLAADHHLHLPPECDELRWLTPYAVLYRYDGEPGEGEEALAREEARERIRRLRAWVEKRLAASAPQQ